MNSRRWLTISSGVALFCVMSAATQARQAPATPAQTSAGGTTPADGVERITIDDLKAMLAAKTPVTIIDVRHNILEKIQGALHIPVDEIEARLNEIPRDREVVTYCA